MPGDVDDGDPGVALKRDEFPVDVNAEVVLTGPLHVAGQLAEVDRLAERLVALGELTVAGGAGLDRERALGAENERNHASDMAVLDAGRCELGAGKLVHLLVAQHVGDVATRNGLAGGHGRGTGGRGGEPQDARNCDEQSKRGKPNREAGHGGPF